MTAPDYLRPDEAAARFGIGKQTLTRWANAGLIGRSRVSRKAVFYPVADIVDVIRHGLEPRTVIPLSADPESVTHTVADDPDAAEFWGVEPSPAARRAERGR